MDDASATTATDLQPRRPPSVIPARAGVGRRACAPGQGGVRAHTYAGRGHLPWPDMPCGRSFARHLDGVRGVGNLVRFPPTNRDIDPARAADVGAEPHAGLGGVVGADVGDALFIEGAAAVLRVAIVEDHVDARRALGMRAQVHRDFEALVGGDPGLRERDPLEQDVTGGGLRPGERGATALGNDIEGVVVEAQVVAIRGPVRTKLLPAAM